MENIITLVDVEFYYNDEPDIIMQYLCAIGEYDENDKECKDLDYQIFFWFDSEEDLKSFMKSDGVSEFTVINYKIK